MTHRPDQAITFCLIMSEEWYLLFQMVEKKSKDEHFDTWELREIQILVFIKEVLLDYNHVRSFRSLSLAASVLQLQDGVLFATDPMARNIY